ncbi:MAG: rod-binding protein [Thaumarchaeota archaeon]|nr:rod-binding protein [Nitrososphaerota archaeon]
MRKSIPEDGLFKKDGAAKLFEEMLDDVFSGEMAKSGQLGIAKAIETQMVQQEQSSGQRSLLNTAFALPAFAQILKK